MVWSLAKANHRQCHDHPLTQCQIPEVPEFRFSGAYRTPADSPVDSLADCVTGVTFWLLVVGGFSLSTIAHRPPSSCVFQNWPISVRYLACHPGLLCVGLRVTHAGSSWMSVFACAAVDVVDTHQTEKRHRRLTAGEYINQVQVQVLSSPPDFPLLSLSILPLSLAATASLLYGPGT